MRAFRASLLAGILALGLPALAQEPVKPAAPAASPDVVAGPPAELPSLSPPFIWRFQGGTTLRLYGRIEFLTSYDTTVPYLGDLWAYVPPAGTFNGDNGSFSMSVRGTIVGVHLMVPGVAPGWAFNSRVEIDFSGGFLTGAMSAYSPLVRLRHAWVSMDSEHVSILAGQGYGIFNPLFPDEGTWLALGTAGNPYIRAPQLRLTLMWDPMKVELSATRPIGGNEVFTDSVNDLVSDGELSKMPFFMARLSYLGDYGGGTTLGLGVSGVYGREFIHREYPFTHADLKTTETSTIDQMTNVWLAGADAKLTTKYVDLVGEFFVGENINQFFAGVLQGVTLLPATLDKATDKVRAGQAWAIRAYGGWGQVSVKPIDRLVFHLGASIDHPRTGDLTYDRTDKKAVVPREYNLAGWVAGNYKLGDLWLVGCEVSYLRTKYLDDNGTNYNLRVMLKGSFIF